MISNGSTVVPATLSRLVNTPAESKNNLGFAYERRGDLGHAYDLYLQATTLDPKSTHARSNLVHAAHELGRDLPASAAPPAVEVTVPSSVVPSGVVPSGGAAPVTPAPPPSSQQDKSP